MARRFLSTNNYDLTTNGDEITCYERDRLIKKISKRNHDILVYDSRSLVSISNGKVNWFQEENLHATFNNDHVIFQIEGRRYDVILRGREHIISIDNDINYKHVRQIERVLDLCLD